MNTTSTTSERKSRVGVILVTHVDYGDKLVEAAQFILGPQDDVATVSVDNSQDVGQTLARLEDAVARLEQGRGVIILTDMFGGTPTNLSLSLLGKGQLEVVTGVNLPMLLRVFGSREKPLEVLAKEAKEAGLKGIVVAGEILRKRVSEN